MHNVKEWKAGLWDHYFFLQEPGTLRQQGHIPFTHDLELQPICFGFNHRTPNGQGRAVVRRKSDFFASLYSMVLARIWSICTW
jgi:hypothetical protein